MHFLNVKEGPYHAPPRKVNRLRTHWYLQWPLCYPWKHKQPRNSIRQIRQVFCKATYNEVKMGENGNTSRKQYNVWYSVFLKSLNADPLRNSGQLLLPWLSSGTFYVQGPSECHSYCFQTWKRRSCFTKWENLPHKMMLFLLGEREKIPMHLLPRFCFLDKGHPDLLFPKREIVIKTYVYWCGSTHNMETKPQENPGREKADLLHLSPVQWQHTMRLQVASGQGPAGQ